MLSTVELLVKEKKKLTKLIYSFRGKTAAIFSKHQLKTICLNETKTPANKLYLTTNL